MLFTILLFQKEFRSEIERDVVQLSLFHFFSPAAVALSGSGQGHLLVGGGGGGGGGGQASGAR